MGSNFLMALPAGFSLPTSSTPSIFTTLKVAEIGPSEPKSVEYTCHPGSILAVNTTSPSAPFPIFKSEEKCTGSIIWAPTSNAGSSITIIKYSLFIISVCRFFISFFVNS